MEIRELDKYDLADLAVLYTHLHVDDETAPSLETLQSTWDAILANPDIHYLGCFVADQMVSTCTIAIIPNLTRRCRSYGLVENVVTHPAFRKKGYGKAVLQQALRLAWKQDCYKVMLMTGRKNEETFRFYEAAGFRRGRKEAFIASP